MDRTSSHLKLLPNVTTWKRIFPVKNGSILGWKRTRFSNLETEDPVDRHPSVKIMSSHGINKQNCLFICFGCILSLVIGFLIGWFSKPVPSPEKRLPNITPFENPNDLDDAAKIIEQIDKENIKRNLRNYTYKPRLTGTENEKDLVDELYNTWKENGLHKVIRTPYKVLLSYPNTSMPNKVQILDKSGTSPLFTSQPYEKNLFREDSSLKLVPPYNSFSPSGVREGELVYVNYGTIKDFQHLYYNHTVNFTSKIVIARYGKIFRGDKLKIAAQFNASGLILYTDPADFNINGFNETYPHSWWLPPEGVQRGTVGADGDYLTPLYPATDYAYRLSLEDIKSKMPSIPCQPIGYGDAMVLLSNLTGDEAPAEWQGKLPIKYRIGPGFLNKDWRVKLTVNNYEEMVTTWNVIGYIQGSEEPDRFVMMGNHHDSWTYSATDPLSGTASLTEITRVMGNMVKEGWQPKRTIVFCSWGGEEQGLIGSTEWVEEHMKVLFNRGVAYLNMDYAVDYTYKLDVYTSPLLEDAMYKAAKQIPNPDPLSSQKTLYDIWKLRTTGSDENSDSTPEISYSLGSGSDMATFYQRAGVPSMDFYYTYDTKKWPILSYPTYHTAYETFHMYSTFIDPSFNYTLAITQLWAILTYDLATADILPFDLRRYSNIIAVYIYSLKCEYEHSWKNHSVNYESLINASIAFVHATEHFHNKIMPSINIANSLAVRRLNDKMIGLERAFIDPEGIPGKPMYKHIVYAPNEYDSYTDSVFPGIREAMWKIENENADLWDLVKQQVSVATYTVISAAQSLDEIGLDFNKH